MHVPSASAPPAILVEDVHHSFGDVVALDGLDLEVQAGTVLGLLGPNGAGKTTLVRILATLLAPTAGRASVLGHDVVGDPLAVRRRIGLAGQSAAVDEQLTGRENVEMIGRLYRLPVSRARARAREVLERFGLAEAADRRVSGYSGGMRRRLDLCASLTGRPPVLLLDEPTTGLDPRTRQELWDTIDELRREGTTVLLTTQYLEEADQLCDRVAIIDDGTIVAEGTPSALKSELGHDVCTISLDPLEHDQARAALQSLAGVDHVTDATEGLAVYVEDGAAAVADMVRLLSEVDIRPKAISLSRPTLDDVFLASTGRRIEGGVPEMAS